MSIFRTQKYKNRRRRVFNCIGHVRVSALGDMNWKAVPSKRTYLTLLELPPAAQHTRILAEAPAFPPAKRMNYALNS